MYASTHSMGYISHPGNELNLERNLHTVFFEVGK